MLTTFSVIIPTYNRAALLRRAVESVLGQSRPPDEVIVVDDGSTDDTQTVVDEYSAVTYLRQGNRGASVARNRGVGAATGAFAGFLDSDDVWRHDFLRSVEEAIEATDGRGWLYFGDLAYAGRDQTLWQLAGLSVTGRWELRDDAAEWLLLARQPMATQSTIIRRDAYLAVGGQDPAILCRHDTHLFFRLGLQGPVCAIPTVGAELTPDAGDDRLTQLHASDTLSYRQDTIRMYSDVLARHPNIQPSARRALRARLAVAYTGVSRNEWSEGRRGDAVRSVGHALAASPGAVARRSIRIVRRGFSGGTPFGTLRRGA